MVLLLALAKEKEEGASGRWGEREKETKVCFCVEAEKNFPSFERNEKKCEREREREREKGAIGRKFGLGKNLVSSFVCVFLCWFFIFQHCARARAIKRDRKEEH
jgi:hypothetical protein